MDTGLRTSTNSGIAGGVTLFTMWLGNHFAPEFMASAPPGAEAVLTLAVAWFVARISVSNTGKKILGVSV